MYWKVFSDRDTTFPRACKRFNVPVHSGMSRLHLYSINLYGVCLSRLHFYSFRCLPKTCHCSSSYEQFVQCTAQPPYCRSHGQVLCSHSIVSSSRKIRPWRFRYNRDITLLALLPQNIKLKLLLYLSFQLIEAIIGEPFLTSNSKWSCQKCRKESDIEQTLSLVQQLITPTCIIRWQNTL